LFSNYLYSFILPAILLVGLYLAAKVRQFFRWRSEARGHCYVCKISDTVDKKYYLCDPPADGEIKIYDKVRDKEGKESRQQIGVLAIGSMSGHTAQYPAKAPANLAASITEYYCDESYQPITMKPIDPLETASVLINICNSIPIKAVLQITERIDELNKKVREATQNKLGSILQVISIIALVALLGLGFMEYRNMSVVVEALRQQGFVR
jgi:hypothetical protein